MVPMTLTLVCGGPLIGRCDYKFECTLGQWAIASPWTSNLCTELRILLEDGGETCKISTVHEASPTAASILREQLMSPGRILLEMVREISTRCNLIR